MRLSTIGALVLALAGVARAGGVEWAKSYKEAMASAKEQGKLVHLHFYADW